MSIPTNPYSSESSLGVTAEDKTLGLVAYILAIFTSWLGPLILWLVKKDQSKFVAFHALQAALLMGAMTVLFIVLNILSIVGHIGFIAAALEGILYLGTLVLNIIAALAANKGDWYEMPVVGAYARKAAGL